MNRILVLSIGVFCSLISVATFSGASEKVATPASSRVLNILDAHEQMRVDTWSRSIKQQPTVRPEPLYKEIQFPAEIAAMEWDPIPRIHKYASDRAKDPKGFYAQAKQELKQTGTDRTEWLSESAFAKYAALAQKGNSVGAYLAAQVLLQRPLIKLTDDQVQLELVHYLESAASAGVVEAQEWLVVVTSRSSVPKPTKVDVIQLAKDLKKRGRSSTTMVAALNDAKSGKISAQELYYSLMDRASFDPRTVSPFDLYDDQGTFVAKFLLGDSYFTPFIKRHAELVAGKQLKR